MSEGSQERREEAGTGWRAPDQEGGSCGERDEYVVPVYVAFEGGGARGVAHVGALRALENPTELPPDNANNITHTPVGTSQEGRFEILGTAGTSAGAIMAALVAAGYTSDELLSEDGGDSLLKRLGFTSMTELFGNGRWWQVRALRWATSHLRESAIFFLMSILFIVALSESFVPHVNIVWAVTIAGLVVVSVFLIARHMAAGLCPTKKVRETLNVALARKLGFDDSHSVTFADLYGKTKRPLRIVATDIERRSMTLFSEQATRTLAVADAVAASIAIPMVFRPHALTYERTDANGDTERVTGRYCDGGLVSNLPAWTFDDEIEKDPDAVILCVEIPDQRPNGRKRLFVAPFYDLIDIVRSALFGGAILNKRAKAGRLYSVALASRCKDGKPTHPKLYGISLLTFDQPKDFYVSLVRESTALAQERISNDLIEQPLLWKEVCCEVHEMCRQQFLSDEPTTDDEKIRVQVASPDPDYPSFLRIHGHYNMDGDSDEGMLLPLDASGPGWAFEKQDTVLLVQDVREVFARDPEIGLAGETNRIRRALIWQEMEWYLSIPLELENGDRHVLTIDSNIPAARMKFDDIGAERFVEWLFDIENTVVEALARKDRHDRAAA